MSDIVIKAVMSPTPVIRPSNSPGLQGPRGWEVQVEYSVDGESWHTTPTSSDYYVHFSTDEGTTWGTAWYIRGEQGEQGATGETGATGATITSVAIVGTDIVFTKSDASTVTLTGAVTTLKGDAGADGTDGATGASIISAAFSGSDIVFTKDDANTVTLADAVTILKGDTGATGETGATGDSAPEVVLNYSIDGATLWHETYTEGDLYVRVSTDGESTWSGAMKFIGDDGADGDDGEPVLIRKGDTHIEWKYESDELWTELVALADLKGEQGDQGIPGNDGNDGADGEEVLLQKTETHIQWKYESASEWSNLVALADIKGDPGETGGDGADGVNGADAEEISLQASLTHIQWKRENDAEWTDLIALSSLKGDSGNDGLDGDDGADGREVLLQKSETHIQWQYDGDMEWQNLVALADLKGETGETGSPGSDGSDGADGDDGTDGNTWYSGSSDPSDESGNDGDFYLNTTSWDVFKKISGEWSLQGNIKGASGEGSGDVIGPEGATAGNLATFSGTSGKIIQDSGSKVADFEPAIGAKGTAFNKNFGSSAGDVCQGNDSRLSDARTPTSHGNDKHSATYITSSDVTYENLSANGDVGTGSSQVAQGDHDHEGTYLESVVDDTTPQLGGDLDVNGKKIISASNGDIPLAPNGSGMVKMGKGVYFSDYISNGTDSCTIDWRKSNKQLVTPSGNRTYTFTAPTGVTSLTLVITVTASRTLYWPAAVSWRGGAPATTAAGTYIATFFWDGTNYFGTCTGKD